MNPTPTCSANPNVRRELAEISLALRSTIRELVSGSKPWPLYLWGPAGTGKTSAALVMLDHCGPRRRDELSPETPDRLANWVHGYAEVRTFNGLKIGCNEGRIHWPGGGAASWDGLLAAVARAPLFVFDEIGVGSQAKDFALDTLLEVLERRAGDPVRPFVVTGNIKPSDLASVYDDRVSSRILAGTAFQLNGLDRRTGRR